MHVSFVATTSNGRTVTEKHDYPVLEGQRKPWVRFLEDLAPGEYLTSLRLQIGKRTIHLPRMNSRFGGIAPQFYSLQYQAELVSGGGGLEERHYLNVGAHYGSMSVHFYADLTGERNCWIEVQTEDRPMAPSPKQLMENQTGGKNI